MRHLLQDSGLTAEETAGFIVAFVVVGFLFAAMGAYLVFQTKIVNSLTTRIGTLESHPKLAKTDTE